jgi:hypothetical protein
MQASSSMDQGGESPPTTATLRFRHSHGSLGVSRHGRIRPDGRLVVEYDPSRLSEGGLDVTDVAEPAKSARGTLPRAPTRARTDE